MIVELAFTYRVMAVPPGKRKAIEVEVLDHHPFFIREISMENLKLVARFVMESDESGKNVFQDDTGRIFTEEKGEQKFHNGGTLKEAIENTKIINSLVRSEDMVDLNRDMSNIKHLDREDMLDWNAPDMMDKRREAIANLVGVLNGVALHPNGVLKPFVEPIWCTSLNDNMVKLGFASELELMRRPFKYYRMDDPPEDLPHVGEIEIFDDIACSKVNSYRVFESVSNILSAMKKSLTRMTIEEFSLYAGLRDAFWAGCQATKDEQKLFTYTEDAHVSSEMLDAMECFVRDFYIPQNDADAFSYAMDKSLPYNFKDMIEVMKNEHKRFLSVEGMPDTSLEASDTSILEDITLQSDITLQRDIIPSIQPNPL